MKVAFSIARLLKFALIVLLFVLAQRASALTTNVFYGGSLGLVFSPATVTIHAGDTIVFTNKDVTGAGGHTVTANSAPDMFCGNGVVTFSCSHTFTQTGTFGYHCIPHVGFGMVGTVQVLAAATPPTVTLSAPAAGTVYAAPASVKLSATAGSTGGTVTSVQYFGDGTSFGSATTPPYNVTSSPLTAGSYSLTAKVSDTTGLSATSAPVSITVVSPVAVSNFAARVMSGQFVFDHTANNGLKYVLERSTNLVNWSPVATNTASSNSIHVSDAFQVGALRFYRVGRVPNP